MKRGLKLSVLIGLGGVLLYCLAMIVVRLRITELAYEFDDAKNDERALKEEQVRLRAEIGKLLTSNDFRRQMKAQGFAEPEPNQIQRIP